MRKTLRRKKLLELINSLESLPILPHAYQDLVEAIESDKSIKNIGRIISSDASIAAKTLQVANSAFYGGKTISSVTDAISHLGLNFIKDQALAFGIIKNTTWEENQINLVEEIFRHSFMVDKYVPVFYKLLYNEKQNKALGSPGVTHDIGKIIMLRFFRERYELIVAHQQDNPEKSFYECELSLGFKDSSHAAIGAFILDMWNLPRSFVESALFHHAPNQSSEDCRNLVTAIQYTDNVLNSLYNAGKGNTPGLSRMVCRQISREKLDQVAGEIIRDRSRMFDF